MSFLPRPSTRPRRGKKPRRGSSKSSSKLTVVSDQRIPTQIHRASLRTDLLLRRDPGMKRYR